MINPLPRRSLHHINFGRDIASFTFCRKKIKKGLMRNMKRPWILQRTQHLCFRKFKIKIDAGDICLIQVLRAASVVNICEVQSIFANSMTLYNGGSMPCFARLRNGNASLRIAATSDGCLEQNIDSDANPFTGVVGPADRENGTSLFFDDFRKCAFWCGIRRRCWGLIKFKNVKGMFAGTSGVIAVAVCRTGGCGRGRVKSVVSAGKRGASCCHLIWRTCNLEMNILTVYSTSFLIKNCGFNL